MPKYQYIMEEIEICTAEDVAIKYFTFEGISEEIESDVRYSLCCHKKLVELYGETSTSLIHEKFNMRIPRNTRGPYRDLISWFKINFIDFMDKCADGGFWKDHEYKIVVALHEIDKISHPLDGKLDQIRLTLWFRKQLI